MAEVLIGGVEGGATNTHCVIMDSSGKIIGKAQGLGSNHTLLGMAEARRRISVLVDEAKGSAGIAKDTPLDGLGLSLSGCEQEDTNKEFLKGLKELNPNLAKDYILSSDSDGSVAATSNKGGITCIAGTGSNTLLINPDGTRFQCGGWGYILGDEGSAFKIAHQTIKYCFNELDDWSPSPHPIHAAWDAIKSHFGARVQADLIHPFYSEFDKAHIASLCKKIAHLAKGGDSLSSLVFEEAGRDLARGIWAVARRASPELPGREGGLHVLGVGAVWLSWELLEGGFVRFLREETSIDKLSLMKLTTEHGVGAAFLASDKLGLPLKRDYSKNYNVFYRFDKSKCDENGG